MQPLLAIHLVYIELAVFTQLHRSEVSMSAVTVPFNIHMTTMSCFRFLTGDEKSSLLSVLADEQLLSTGGSAEATAQAIIKGMAALRQVQSIPLYLPNDLGSFLTLLVTQI